MTMMQYETVPRRLRRASWIGSLALVAVGLTVVLLGWLSHRGLSLVVDSQLTARLTRESRSLALDRDAAIRGYLLSHQQVSLAPEIAARAPLRAKLDSLVILSAGNPSQLDRARAIRASVDRWDRGWARPVLDEAISGEAATVRETLAGKELFDSIRSAFQSFTSGEQRIYSSRIRMLGILQRLSFALLIAEIVTLLAVLFWFARRALDQARTLLDQQEQLEAQSLDLQQQTAILEEQAVELEEQADEANANANALSETNRRLEETIRRLEAAEESVSTERSDHLDLESLLDSVIRNSPAGIALYDSEKQVVRTNPAMEKITGGAIPGDGDLREAVDEMVAAVLASNLPAANVPLSGGNGSGTGRERHFLCSFFPVTFPGRKNGVGVVALETTQFRQLEEQLMQAQKMEAVGRLAGGVAHDFNNMLTAIMSYSDLLLADMPPQSQQRSDMSEIIKAAQKATALTKKLLAFSRQQVLRPTRVDLNATIDGLKNMITRLLGKEIDFSVRLGRDLWTISADATEIERVVMNLVLNARDAMSGGGHLTIETSNVTIDDDYASTHADTRPGSYVVVTVTDSGAGMTREVREKLFEPFFTTKQNGGGTGLGLPSVYGIVKQSGGFIWVYSEPGKGTTFKVYLPRSEEPPFNASRTSSRSRQVGSETILLVEDNEDVRNVATRILRRNGYRVLEAHNGAEALRLCDSETEPVDLIVTDIVMPEMGGSELAKRIRETQPDARILFTSGYTEDAAVRQSLLQSGEDFIEKPFTPTSLANKAREILASDKAEEP